MHILHLTETFSPRIGGVERHVLHLSQELVRQGHQVSVLARSHDPSLPVRERVGSIEVRRLSPARAAGAPVRPAWTLLLPHLDLLRGADLVHVHDHTPFFRTYFPFRFLLPRTPVFMTFHGHEGNFPPARRDVIARRCAARLVRGTLCVGHYVGKWYGTRSHAVTYGAVEARETEGPGLPPAPGDQNAGGPEARGAIVFLGRLEPDTGILSFLQGLSLMPRKAGARPGLVVCGEGSLEREVRDFAARKSLNVDLRGIVPDPLHWVRQSRFVFASGYLSMLEGMICRRLVFGCYDNELKHDYWGMLPNAREMMVICGSPEELAWRFQEVLDRPDLEKALVERAWEFARLQTWERLAGLYLDLYRSGILMRKAFSS